VIGSVNQSFNTAMDFQNPANHQASLLIHLPNGDFVAYEKACTAGGASVSYNAETHTLVCPTDGSLFDPANDGAILQGPAARPLTRVMVQVNADGTITAGQ
jgi:Rieske Fe-S protein